MRFFLLSFCVVVAFVGLSDGAISFPSIPAMGKLNPFAKKTDNTNATETVTEEPTEPPHTIAPPSLIVTPKTEKGRWSGLPRGTLNVFIKGSKKVVNFGVDVGKTPYKVIKTGVTMPVELVQKGVRDFNEKLGVMNKNSRGLDSNATVAKGKTGDFLKKHINSIFPGTKWCGGGDIADSYNDLGLFSKLDSCCREHDKCPENILAGEEKNGLKNTGLFTRSHCSCDEAFYTCLKDSKHPVAFGIGTTYFDILGPQCWREDYPLSACTEWIESKSNQLRCVSYEMDTSLAPVFQWFDNPLFSIPLN